MDPRKPGQFRYRNLDYEFPFEPFYVGKGKDTRYKRHLNKTQLDSGSNNIKRGKLRHIIDAGHNPLDYVLLMFTGLSSEEACEKEQLVIAAIGRLTSQTGPLANLTDGGEGMVGYSSPHKGKTYEELHGVDEATRLKKERRERFLGSKNPMFGKPGPFSGKAMSDEAKANLSARSSKPVKQMDDFMRTIKVWPSALAASKALGLAPTSITNCLSPKLSSRSAGGCRWEYVSTPNNKYPHSAMDIFREQRGEISKLEGKAFLLFKEMLKEGAADVFANRPGVQGMYLQVCDLQVILFSGRKVVESCPMVDIFGSFDVKHLKMLAGNHSHIVIRRTLVLKPTHRMRCGVFNS